MASLSYKNGKGVIQFTDNNGERHSMRTGNLTEDEARVLKSKITDLANAAYYGLPLRDDTVAWLSSINISLYNKLAKHGLVKPRNKAKLKDFILNFIKNHHVKQSTKGTLHRAKRYLVEFFGPDCDMRSIDSEQASRWFHWMTQERDKPLSESTARKTVSITRQFWDKAKDQSIVEECPFKKLPGTIKANRKRMFFVTREMSERVLLACPDAEWRAMFTLARYGGLRIPSEIRELKCRDIDLKQKAMTIHSPKTEHHENGGIRVVPIFPELMPYLLPVLEGKEPEDHLLPKLRHLTNPWPQLRRIVESAGLKPWPKLWQNLRSTRETELMDCKIYSPQTVCQWIGNSPMVAMKHYLQVREEEFKHATGDVTGEALQNALHEEPGALQSAAFQTKEKESPKMSDSLISLLHKVLQSHAPEYAVVKVRSNGPYKT